MIFQGISWRSSLSDWPNLVELLDVRAAELGEEFATFPEETVSFQNLAERSQRVASGLNVLNIGEGDRVAVMMYNRSTFPVVYFGVLHADAVIIPINVSLRGDDLEYPLTDADPRAAIVGSDCIDNYWEVEDAVAIDEQYVAGTDVVGFAPLERTHGSARGLTRSQRVVDIRPSANSGTYAPPPRRGM